MPLGKYFYIKSRLDDNLVVEVQGDGKAPGTPVVLLPRKPGLPTDQLWWEDHVSGCIRSDLDPELVLSIDATTRQLVVDTWSDVPDKHWLVVGEVIQNRGDQNTVLEVTATEDGQVTEESGVGVGPATGGDNQKWIFEYQEARLFRIHSEMNGKCLTLKEKSKDKKLVMCDNAGLKSQMWYEDKHGILYNVTNGFCIDSKKGIGKSVRLEYFEPGQPSLMWIKAGKKIINQAQPSQVLDIKGADQKEGAKVIAYHLNEQSNQHWLFQYVDPTPGSIHVAQ